MYISIQIGYTNAGKTALLNLMTGAKNESEDKLFQTLNTSSKRFRMGSGQQGLMLDTVGFITNLPHALVESFKATLEELTLANVLVHVRDISNPQTNFQRNTVLQVLRDIGVSEEVFEKKYIEVWNKIDLLHDYEKFKQDLESEQQQVDQKYPIVHMSCKSGYNKDRFLKEVTRLSSNLMNKNQHVILFKFEEQEKVCKWLNENAGISYLEEIEYDEES